VVKGADCKPAIREFDSHRHLQLNDTNDKDTMSDSTEEIYLEERKNMKTLHAERRKLIKRASKLARDSYPALAQVCWDEIDVLEQKISISEKRMLSITGDI
jgi:hypothetical protein